MKRHIGFALASALLVSACVTANAPREPSPGSTTAAFPPVSPVNPAAKPAEREQDCGLASGMVMDEKALYAVETAYNVPANAYVTFDAAGKIPPDLKAQVRPLLLKAYDALKVARGAYAVGNSCDFFTAVANVKYFANAAKALMPKPK